MGNKTEVGVEAVVDGFGTFLTELGLMNKAISGAGKTFITASTGVAIFSAGIAGIVAVAAGAVAAIGLVTGGLIALGKEAITTAIDVESAFALVLKTTDGLGSNLFELTEVGEDVFQGFRDLATEIPVALEDLLRTGEIAGQLGVPNEALVEFSRTVAELALTTDLTADSAAKDLARIGNIYQVEADEMAESTRRIGSSVVELGNTFATSEPEILNFASRIAGVGQVVGFTQADILGIAAAFTAVGVPAERGGTAVQKVAIKMLQAVQSFGDGTGEVNEKLKTFADTAGSNVEAFVKLFEEDAIGAFQAFVGGLTDAGDDAINVLDDLELKDQRLVQAFLSVAGAGALLTQSVDASNESSRENIALSTEAEKLFATMASKIDVTGNKFRDLALTLGLKLAPALIDDTIPALSELSDKIAEGLDPVVENITQSLKENLIPALFNLAESLGFPTTVDDMADAILRFGDNVAKHIDSLSRFIDGISILIDKFKEGGIEKVLEALGFDDKSAQLILDVADALGIFAAAFVITKLAFIGGSIIGVAAGHIKNVWKFANLAAIALANAAGAKSLAGAFQGVAAAGVAAFGPAGALLIAITGLLFVLDKFGPQAKENLEGLKEQFGIISDKAGETFNLMGKIIKIRLAQFFVFLSNMAQGAVKFVLEEGKKIIDGWIAIFGETKITLERILKIAQISILNFLLNMSTRARDLVNDFFNLGRRIIQALVDGFESAKNFVINSIGDIGESIKRKLQGVLRIGSPSKVFVEFGKSITEGLAVGIKATMSMPEDAVVNLAERTVSLGAQIMPRTTGNSSTSIDRSFNMGDFNTTTRPENPNRVIDDMALVAALAG